MRTFYNRFTSSDAELIQKISPFQSIDGQPEFIHRVMLNDQEVAFLGQKPNDYEQLEYNCFARIDRMTLPAMSRMVNNEALLNQLPPLRTPPVEKPETVTFFGYDDEYDKGKEDMSAIDVDKSSFFYDGQLQRNVAMDVLGLVTEQTEKRRHFHSCHNYGIPSVTGQPFKSGTNRKSNITAKKDRESINLQPLETGSGGAGQENNCGSGNLSSYFKGGQLQYALNLFYIDTRDFSKIYLEEFVEIAEIGEFSNGKLHAFGSIESNLSAYFAIDDGVYNGVELDWGDDPDNPNIKGIFLLPMFFPDQRIVYLCLLNKDGESNGGLGIKENLRRWFEAIAFLNKNPIDRELYIGAGDLYFAGIDQLAMIVGKIAFPVIINNRLLREYIERSRISIKKENKTWFS